MKRSFAICLTGTVLLAAGVIFLPRYISRSLDLRNLNRISLTDRDQFSYMEPSSYDLPGNDEGFRSLINGKGELTLITSFDRQTTRLNEEMLQEMYDQVFNAQESGMLPNLTGITDRYAAMGLEPSINEAIVYGEDYESTLDWLYHAESAEYYSLVYTSGENSHVKNMLNFWLVHYTDMLYQDYYFLVNEDNYKIYYAWIYNPYTDYLCSILDQVSAAYDQDAERILLDNMYMAADGCTYYYEADFCEIVSWADAYAQNYPVTMHLAFGEKEVTMEQRPLTAGRLGYRGIGIGLQSVGGTFSVPEN